jgi:hypothetical protein
VEQVRDGEQAAKWRGDNILARKCSGGRLRRHGAYTNQGGNKSRKKQLTHEAAGNSEGVRPSKLRPPKKLISVSRRLAQVRPVIAGSPG